LWQVIGDARVSTADGRNRGLTGRDNCGLVLRFSVVIVLSAHLGITGDHLLARFSARDGSSHCAGHNSTDQYHDGGGEYNVRPPRHVRNEDKHIDQEGKQTNEKVDDKEDEEN
jgi:hypothetical protein